jgi:quinate dehydrogenase (quinone)
VEISSARSVVRRGKALARASVLLAVLLSASGVVLLAGGVQLATLGGSWYYLLTGIAFVVASVLLFKRRPGAIGIVLAVLVATIAWSAWESGLQFWGLFPRLMFVGAVAALGLLVMPALVESGDYRLARASVVGGITLVVALLVMLGLAFVPHGQTLGDRDATTSAGAIPSAAANGWQYYGKDSTGSRFAGISQINASNVASLERAWTYHTGDLGPGEDQNVPLQVGDLVYTCSRSNHVAALDADTGKPRWTFDPGASSPIWQRCRGLGYHDLGADAPDAGNTACRRRIILTTIDARLIALDAATGSRCPGFGAGGEVSLRRGMGEIKPGAYFQTSAPLVAGNKIVIGGWVRDNQERGEPSGVVRAFDVETGRFLWAWDLGNALSNAEPEPGKSYSRGTPNMWATASYDAGLDAIYLPIGNATPDYFGAGRSEASERFASSVASLDAETGALRWKFQTVHHDLWDYDVSAQPALVDLPDGKGGVVHALVQPTKRGQIFLLDRVTGKPLADVVEKPVPKAGKAPEEWLSPTQPYSIGMPSIGTAPLSEQKMWGMTLFDQLWCRIAFKKLRYEGEFTPPGPTGSIEYPSNYGGINWGSTSFDPQTATLFVNDIRMPVMVQLLPPAEAEALIKSRKGQAPNRHGPAPQRGTPYGVNVVPMLSPLGVPCSQPPFGTLTAINLVSRKIAWQVPVGTPRDTGPLGLRTHLPMPLGMPTIGGTLATESGLVFFAGSQDFYLRAFDSRTGKEVWRGRLPVGSGSTPMTYVSPKSGRQYVVISAGGAPSSPVRGDQVFAFALPEKK